MNCKYHTNEKAQWHCHDCDIPFCLNCCDINEREIAPRCLLCRNHLESYGVSDKIEPFWNKIPEFNKYPWQKNATNFLMTFIGIAFIVGLISDFISFFIIQFLLELTVFSIGIGYVFTVLTRTAKGKFDSPSYDEALVFNTDSMTVKVIFLFLSLVGTGILIAKGFGFTALMVYFSVVLFCSPAMLIILAMEKHVVSAVDIRRIFGTAITIGWPYLLLVALSCLIYFCLFIAQGYVHFWLPQAIAYPLIFGTLAYFCIIKFNMFGYVAFQYHSELGYGIDTENLISNQGDENIHVKRLMSKADVYIQEGRFEDAENTLYELAEDKQNTVKALERLVRLNIVRRNPAGAIKAAKSYYENPKLEHIGGEALRLYQEMIAFEPHFKPMNAKARAVLLNHMKHKRYLDDVSKLTSITEKMEKDVNLPWLMLARARFESEVMNNDAGALSMLNKLLSRHPRGPHQYQAEQLRKVCSSMQEKTAGAAPK